ncbi:MAG TPA: putative sugar nucleotidyl transferase [Tepidisphaeraceae bacterium]|jgi:UDP-N-acetylglucosamine diphosphorylase/glucosamine-1-phosphate N-acetyltransferase|nr:putative sugar nucleotidyl transferase [Tepidisphaeraceae bacterium]
MHVVIFEDSRWHALAPLSLSRPVFSLTSGMTSLLEKQIRHLKPARLTLWVRPEFESVCRERIAPLIGVPTQVNTPLDDRPALLIHGRLAPATPFEIPAHEAVYAIDGTILAAMTSRAGLGPADALGATERWLDLLRLPGMAAQGSLIESPIDLIYANERSLIDDFACLKAPSQEKKPGPYYFVNEAAVWLGRDVALSPGCVLDAARGPIAIGAGASVGANAVIQGPCYIGPGATVAPVANIRGGVTIGPVCKIGGEVSASVFMGYSNKGHEGFVGHSYIGQWVNLGAGTTTSNMKNTYGPITLRRGNTEIGPARGFLGAVIGDHCKTAIHTRLMGGSYIGFCSMLAGTTAVPRFIPSFAFWTDEGVEPYRFSKAIEVAQRVLARRKITWTAADEHIMDYAARIAPTIEI